MGYYTYYNGELAISPPLTEAERSRLAQVVNFQNSDEILKSAASDVFNPAWTPLTADDTKLATSDNVWATFNLELDKIADISDSVKGYDNELSLAVAAEWLELNGHRLSGQISWSGDDNDDQGTIYAEHVGGKNLLEFVQDEPSENQGPSWNRKPVLGIDGELNHRELATILHALRTIQSEGRIEGCAAAACDHFDDVSPLSNQEIDTLCERINLRPARKP